MIQSINKIARKIPTWPIYVLAVGYFSWLYWLALDGRLGVDPVRSLEHALGDIAIQTFIAVLAITPLRRHLGLNLIRFRRALGLSVFFFVCTHLWVWLYYDVQIWSLIWADIVKRPYITIGMIAFVGLIPLAATSNDWTIRKMGGRAWMRLHKLSYPAVLLGAVHNVMVQKVWESESLFYLSAIIALLALRLPWKQVGMRFARA